MDDIDVDEHREVLGAADGMKEDSESWLAFLHSLKEHCLSGCRLVIDYRNLGLLEAATTVYPQAKYQHCTVHFYRKMFSVTPKSKVRTVATMLKAIHAREDKKAALEKAGAVSAKLQEMKLRAAADKLDQCIGETLTYMDFPSQHWSKIRTNNFIGRLNRDIRCRTRVVGTFPDGRSALMLVCARARYVTNSHWGTKCYMSMKHLNNVTICETDNIAG